MMFKPAVLLLKGRGGQGEVLIFFKFRLAWHPVGQSYLCLESSILTWGSKSISEKFVERSKGKKLWKKGEVNKCNLGLSIFASIIIFPRCEVSPLSGVQLLVKYKTKWRRPSCCLTYIHNFPLFDFLQMTCSTNFFALFLYT